MAGGSTCAPANGSRSSMSRAARSAISSPSAPTTSASFCRPAIPAPELMRLTLGAGDRLVSVRRVPMFEIVEDTVGSHDMIFPACDPPRYRLGFGLDDHRSCRANLAEAMADHGIAYEHLPDPINFFQNTPVRADGSIAYGASSVGETRRQGGAASPGRCHCRRVGLRHGPDRDQRRPAQRYPSRDPRELRGSGLRCEVVAIGTELLLGQIVDTNSSWIGERLALIGIDSHFQTKVGDNAERMEFCINQALERSDAVICCGGLGPTQDRHHPRGDRPGNGGGASPAIPRWNSGSSTCSGHAAVS